MLKLLSCFRASRKCFRNFRKLRNYFQPPEQAQIIIDELSACKIFEDKKKEEVKSDFFRSSLKSAQQLRESYLKFNIATQFQFHPHKFSPLIHSQQRELKFHRIKFTSISFNLIRVKSGSI